MEIIKWDPKNRVLFFKTNGTIYKAKIIDFDEKTGICKLYVFNINQTITLNLRDKNENLGPLKKLEEFSCNSILSPISGRVIEVFVKQGDIVKQNDRLVTIESMKMENEIRAPFDLFVKTVSISKEDLVKQNQLLIEVEEFSEKHPVK